MPEITQRLGFEATQAIATLRQLQGALSSVNRQLRAMNTATQAQNQSKVIQGFAQVSNSAKQATGQVNAAGGALENTGKKGAKAAQNITLSWQTMLRVVQTQLIVRGLNAIVQGFGESANAASEFQLIMAQTSVIAEGAGSSFGQLSQQALALSAEIGRPLQEVAEATFEAMQRGIGDVQQNFELLRGSAHDLALTTRGELFTALQVTSDIINAYGLNISDAADISDVFFVTVDRGNITLEEFRNQLGRITPLSANLGVGIDELGASIAAMTLQGLDGASAQTQLRNVLQKMLKPTTELKGAFAELGVASGQELIEATGGLVPALQALLTTTNGNTTALAAMFGRIRATLGVLNLLTDDARIFNSVMEDMEDRTGRAAAAAEEIEGIDAREAARQMETLNKTFIELGGTTLKVRTNAISLFNSIISDGEAATKAIAIATIAITFLGIKGAAALTSISLAGAGLTVLFGGLVVAAAALGVALGELLVDPIGDARKAQQETLESLNKATTDSFDKQREEARAENVERKNLLQDYLNFARQKYAEEVSEFQKRSNSIIASHSSVINNLKSALQGVSQTVRDFANSLGEQLQNSVNSLGTALQNLDNFKFDRSIRGLNDQEKAVQLNRRAATQTREAIQALNQATQSGNQEARAQALASLDAATATAKRAESASTAAQSIAGENQALDLQQRILESIAQSEQQNLTRLANLQEDFSEKNVATVEAATQQIAESLDRRKELFAESQDISLTDAARESARQELEAIDQEIASKLGELFSSKLLDDLNLVEPLKNAVLNAAEALDAIQLEGEINLANLQQQLENARLTAPILGILQQPTGSTRADQAISAATEGVGSFANEAQVLTARVKAAEDLLATNLDNAQAHEDANNAIEAQVPKVNALLGSVNELKNSIGDVRLAQGVGQSLAIVFSEIRTATEAELAGLEARLKDIAASNPLSEFNKEGAGQAVQDAITATQEAINQKKLQLQLEPLLPPETVNALQERVNEITSQLELGKLLELDPNVFEEAKQGLNDVGQTGATNAQTIGTEFQASGTTASTAVGGIQQSINSIDTSGAVAQMNNLAAAAQRALAASQAAAGSGGSFAHFGKVVYRAHGGPLTRGLDRQLVAMQPGETVINRRASSQFFSELRAINSGQAPQFREHGGPVTNIGDINVNVHSSEQINSLDARTIASGIRRELRRNTSLL